MQPLPGESRQSLGFDVRYKPHLYNLPAVALSKTQDALGLCILFSEMKAEIPVSTGLRRSDNKSDLPALQRKGIINIGIIIAA